MPGEPSAAKDRAGDVAVFLAPPVAALAISPVINDGLNWGYLVFSIAIGVMAVLGRREGRRKSR
jgi:GAF domain-containing protein